MLYCSEIMYVIPQRDYVCYTAARLCMLYCSEIMYVILQRARCSITYIDYECYIFTRCSELAAAQPECIKQPHWVLVRFPPPFLFCLGGFNRPCMSYIYTREHLLQRILVDFFWLLSRRCMSYIHTHKHSGNKSTRRDSLWYSGLHFDLLERWGAGVEYHFQEFNEPYAPS